MIKSQPYKVALLILDLEFGAQSTIGTLSNDNNNNNVNKRSSVPGNVKNASTLSSFKYNIRKVDLSMLLDDNNCSNCSLCTS